MSDGVPSEGDSQSEVPIKPVNSADGFHWKPFVIITLVLGGVFPIIAWYGHHQYQQAGVTAVTLAAILCWLGSILGIMPTLFMRKPEQGINAVLLGMLIRMSIPIGGGFVLHVSVAELAEAKLLMFTLIYFLIALFVDTVLALRIVQATKQETKASC